MERKPPFVVNNPDELLEQFGKKEQEMITRRLSLKEWLEAVYKKSEQWRLSPDTEFMQNLAALLLSETGDIVFEEKREKDEFQREAISGMVDSLETAMAEIGRKDRRYFGLTLQEISQLPKEITYIAPIKIEEPGYTDTYREKHPIGISVLPYFVDDDGKYYINVVVRNEPAALNHTVIAPGEQTSLTKMTGSDILAEPGGPILSYCVLDIAGLDCETVRAFEEDLPETEYLIGFENSNRDGGGFQTYAIARLEPDSQLFGRYSGNWYKLDDIINLLEEHRDKKPLANTFLTNCLFVLQNERFKKLEKTPSKPKKY